MAESIELEVATPERELVREQVESAQIPAKEGYLGILPGHAPLVGQLGAGCLSYRAGGRNRSLAVAGGFVEVLPDRVRVLADVAERAEEIDVPRAQAALKRATDLMGDPNSGVDPADINAAVDRANARIAAAEQR